MIRCINCNTGLIRQETDNGVFYGCPECGSRAAGFAMLKNGMGTDEWHRMLRVIEEKKAESGRNCPGCNREMREISIVREPHEVTLDVCLSCRMVWFDPKEPDEMDAIAATALVQVDWAEYGRRENAEKKWLRRLTPPPPSDPPPHMQEPGPTDFDPMTATQFLLGWLGMPIEENGPKLKRYPFVTWSIAAICFLVSLIVLLSGHADSIFQAYGFVAEEPLRKGGLTLFTSVFLHGSGLHLLGNLYFLLIFGDNVEDELGRIPFLILFFLGAFMGDAIGAGLDPRTQMPSIGASGGISAILTFYACTFPGVKLAFMFRLGFLFKWFRLPAWILFVAWLGIQLLIAHTQMSGHGTTSGLAHLGGVLVGLGFWLIVRINERSRETAVAGR